MQRCRGVRLLVSLSPEWNVIVRGDSLEACRNGTVVHVEPLVSTPIDPARWREQVTHDALPSGTTATTIDPPILAGARWPCGITELVIDNAARQLHVFFQILWWVGHIWFELDTIEAREEALCLASGVDLDWSSAEVACLAEIWPVDGSSEVGST